MMLNLHQFYMFFQIQTVKQEVSCTVILLPVVSVLWFGFSLIFTSNCDLYSLLALCISFLKVNFCTHWGSTHIHMATMMSASM